ncbi:hypothetical protein N7457_003757 [Penicillium paradoxum]|uniref:uncharacterized protein n=1 Tax=Penicillium paradoxum TaxID=176176 RepID=UPI002546D113|nr:uncharacterized protein N7457_003757 [Penicillium paradoxum]KAJ5788767.1 hypothetical protein N7457_003757 [Penicillium paradoxum]
MDGNVSEYEQPSLARKKSKPALADLQRLLVTYRGLQQMQREVNENLAVCRRQIAKYKLGSVPKKSRRRHQNHLRSFQFVRSPLSQSLEVEEEPPTFWGRVGSWFRGWW